MKAMFKKAMRQKAAEESSSEEEKDEELVEDGFQTVRGKKRGKARAGPNYMVDDNDARTQATKRAAEDQLMPEESQSENKAALPGSATSTK